jgi:hypothetical protein
MGEVSQAEDCPEEEAVDHALARAVRRGVDLEGLLEIARKNSSWGYTRRGNAYARKSAPKVVPEPLDVDDEQAPHG